MALSVQGIISITPRIVISGTTAEDYLIKNNPEIKLQKYDTYANAKNALENGNAIAWANDNTEVIAYALQNPGYTVGIPSLGSQDTIAPAVSKRDESAIVMRCQGYAGLTVTSAPTGPVGE